MGREAGRRISSRVIDELRLLARALPDSPLGWEARDELAPGMRRALRPPYAVYYRVGTETIEIIRVLHGSRDLEAVFRATRT